MSLLLLFFISMLSDTFFTIDFTDEEQTSGWYIVNDGVMGGRSNGSMKYTPEGVVFKGEVSLENNGGFSSMRSPFKQMDLSAYSTVSITYKSAGVTQAFQFSDRDRYYMPKYKIHLPNSEEWHTITMPLREVPQYQMGNKTGATIPQDALKNIIRMGFITHEKKRVRLGFWLRRLYSSSKTR